MWFRLCWLFLLLFGLGHLNVYSFDWQSWFTNNVSQVLCQTTSELQEIVTAALKIIKNI